MPLTVALHCSIVRNPTIRGATLLAVIDGAPPIATNHVIPGGERSGIWIPGPTFHGVPGKRRRRVSRLLHPKLVHAGESIRILRFKLLPAIEIRGGPACSGKFGAVTLEGRLVELEPDEFDTVLSNKILYLDYVHPRFLHMKQEIAAFACCEKIGEARDTGKWRLHKLLAAAPDFGRRWVKTVLGDEGARGRDIAAAGVAVKREMHDATGSQQFQQNAPTVHRIRHVMQHAACIDNVEAATDRYKFEDIGLRIVDTRRQVRWRLPPGVAKTAEAQIDRKGSRD